MSLTGRSLLIGVSLACHALLGIGLAAIPPKHHRETIAITMREAKKPKPPPKAEPPPPEPPEPQVKAPAHAAKAKAAPAPKAAPTPAANAPAASSMDALPDFGISMSGGPGGLAVPGGGGGGGGSPAPAQ